jgi:hypothetical protein
MDGDASRKNFQSTCKLPPSFDLKHEVLIPVPSFRPPSKVPGQGRSYRVEKCACHEEERATLPVREGTVYQIRVSLAASSFHLAERHPSRDATACHAMGAAIPFIS